QHPRLRIAAGLALEARQRLSALGAAEAGVMQKRIAAVGALQPIAAAGKAGPRIAALGGAIKQVMPRRIMAADIAVAAAVPFGIEKPRAQQGGTVAPSPPAAQKGGADPG